MSPEFETKFENILGCESGAFLGSIHEKNQNKKISCCCLFKVEYGIVFVLFTNIVDPHPVKSDLKQHE